MLIRYHHLNKKEEIHMIKSWSSLDVTEKAEALRFIFANSKNSNDLSNDEREKYLTSNIFNKGDTLMIYFNHSKIIGSIGIVTAEIQEKKESFITEINCISTKVFKELMNMAIDIAKNKGANIVSLGLKPHNDNLTKSVKDFDFLYSHSFIKLVHDNKRIISHPNLVPLNKDNTPLYAAIMTSGFMNTPNGATVSDDEAYSLLEEPLSNKYGLFKINGLYVGVYELRIKDDTGWIDGIAISPDEQEKGYGKMLLNQCMGYLYSLGVKKIEMMVADTNKNALQLYLNNDFHEKELLSTWFKKTFPSS